MFIFIIIYALHIALQANLILLVQQSEDTYLPIAYIFICVILPTIVIFLTDLRKGIDKSIKYSSWYNCSVAFGTLHCLMIFKEYYMFHTMIISTVSIMMIILVCINKHVAIAKSHCIEDAEGTKNTKGYTESLVNSPIEICTEDRVKDHTEGHVKANINDPAENC